MTLAPEGRKVLFGQGRVRVTASQPRGIVVAPPPPPTSGGQGHGAQGGQGQAHGDGQGKGRGGGNSLAALAAALGAVSATGGKVLPSPDVGTTWYSGTGAPLPGLGTLADWYCDRSTLSVYRKDLGATVAYAGAGAALGVNAIGGNLPAPLSVSAGDLLVMVTETSSTGAITTATTMTPPDGWTRLGTRSPGSFASYAGSCVECWYKVAATGEPGNYPIAYDHSTTIQAIIFHFTGSSKTVPINAVAQTPNQTFTTSWPTPTVTTTAAGCMICSLPMGVDRNTTIYTPPSGFTTQVDSRFASANMSIVLGTETQSVAGATGALVWTVNANPGFGDEFGLTFAVALDPTASTWVRVGAFSA